MITLTLGSFTFARGEVPESIAFGSSQQLHVHTLVGGGRVIDAMGMVPVRLAWSGWFVGPQALDRARALKQLAEAGAPLPLLWGEFAYTVVISAFSAEFRAGPNLPYSITLEVVSDLAAAAPGDAPPGLAQMMTQDLANVSAHAATIGDDGLIAAVAMVSLGVNNTVGPGGSAPLTPAVVRPLLPVIAQAQSVAAALNSTASVRIAALVPLAIPAVMPAGPGALGQFGSSLAQAATATNQSGLLNATSQALSRIATNLTAVAGVGGNGGTTLTTGSTDLYHLAAAAYGDARGWTRIAQANQLTDPAIAGITQLVIPAANGVAATGVLNA